MVKNIIIVLVILLLTMVGVGAFMLMKRPQTTPQSSTTQTPSNTIENKSFKDLLAGGTNQTCTFSDQELGSSGVMYMGNGSARGDFTSKMNNTVTGSHMITDSEYMYTWIDGATEGFKVSRSSVEEQQENTPKTSSTAIDINRNVDYSCSPWSVDSALFTPPSTVTFTDTSTMMKDALKNLPPSSEGTTVEPDTTEACAACDNLPSDSKTQCKTALKCQ